MNDQRRKVIAALAGSRTNLQAAGMAPTPAARRPMGQLKVHEPSLRERIGNAVYDATGNNRLRGVAQAGADFVPGVGEALGAQDAAEAWRAGNYGQAAVNAAGTALGALPGGDALAGVGKAIFAGVGARTANREMLTKAQHMLAANREPSEIWEQTGWMMGPDRKWRFEIDDSKANLTDEAAQDIAGGFEAKIGSSDGFRHDDLYAAYPELRNMKAHNRVSPGADGTFYGDSIGVKNTLRQNMNSTMLHELQHAVQKIENFAGGGASSQFRLSPDQEAATHKRISELLSAPGADGWLPDEAMREIDELNKKLEYGRDGGYEGYHRLAGEVEARNVQDRQRLTAEERRGVHPAKTQDVPYRKQLVWRDR